jgi:uncharacterized membrane protein YhaH (DUF805 family)
LSFASRRWIGSIFSTAFTAASAARRSVAEYLGGDRPSAIVDLAFTYPEFAVAVKRVHDRNLPVWLLGVFFAANAALDLLTVLRWDTGDDKPTILWTVIAIPFLVLALALIIELGFRKGTTGPNQYGPDPLASG